MRFRMTPARLFPVVLVFSAVLHAETLSQKVDAWVLEKSAAGSAEFLVMLRAQGDLRGASALTAKAERGAFVMDSLRSLAAGTQKPLLDLLAERGIPHRSYWVANMIWVRGDRSLVEELAARDDVFHIYANPRVRFQGPVASSPAGALPDSPDEIEWGVAKVHAPEVWALGYSGEGIVVGGQDTGYDWEHPAIKQQYRGWLGLGSNHNYNWHDSIHSGGGSCGADSPEPCDDHSHGTHTMGTMVGDDGGANQIGVAPGGEVDRLPQHGRGRRHAGDLLRVLPVVHRSDESRGREPRPQQGAARDQQLLGLPSERRLHGPDDPRRPSSRTRAPRASRSSSPPATPVPPARPSNDPPGDL